MILKRLWRRSAPQAETAHIPEGRRIYAVGDIHGRADLLARLRTMIAEDVARHPGSSPTTVFLGDYVDRGAESKAVLDMLAREAFPTPIMTLKGNHEAMMMGFLSGEGRDTVWIQNGGLETLHSYGVDVTRVRSGGGFDEAAESLREAMPAEHGRFLTGLQLTLTVGDYFFCHAGVRPGTPLERQVEGDLLWIREEFLTAKKPFGKVVVHGHTPTEQPEVRSNRINVDTGAYISGRLTCLVLEGAKRRFLVADRAGLFAGVAAPGP